MDVIGSYAAATAILALLALVPGPDVAVVTRFALTSGPLPAIRAALGVVLGLTGYAVVFSRSRSLLNRPRVRRLLDGMTGFVLIGFGLRVAAETR